MPTVKEVKAPHGRSVAVFADGNGAYSVSDQPTDHPRVQVTVQAGFNQVQLPNGRPYDEGDTVILTLAELDQIDPAVFTEGILVNDGFVDAAGGLPQEEGTIRSIVVAGADVDDSITDAATNQYTATVTYFNGDTEDFDDTNSDAQGVIWASSTPAAATIDADGLAAGVAPGTTEITASLRGVTSPGVTLTVTAA